MSSCYSYALEKTAVLLLQTVTFSVACQRWTSQPNTNYANGRGNPATSVQVCQAACVANADCSGVDWVTNEAEGRQCWLSGPWSGAQGSTTDVTHYVLNRNCQGKFQDLDIIDFT